MDNNIHLGPKIRKYRHLAGMTQEELAEYSNLSVNYISKIEREKNKTSVLKNSSTSATPLTFPLKKYLIVNIIFQLRTFRQMRLSWSRISGIPTVQTSMRFANNYCFDEEDGKVRCGSERLWPRTSEYWLKYVPWWRVFFLISGGTLRFHSNLRTNGRFWPLCP